MSTDEGWRESAACRGMPTVLFYSEEGKKNARMAEGRKVCATCPVVTPCLRASMGEPHEPYGLWGGLSAPERERYLVGRLSNLGASRGDRLWR